MDTNQSGSSAWDVLWVLSIIVWLGWIASDFLPADADSVQAVVSLAAKSPAAKAELVAALKETPNPDRSDLNKIRKRVNEIIVTETAREVTGDTTLKTPTEMDSQRDRALAAREAKLESTSWESMSNEEKVQYLSSKWAAVLGAMVAAIALFFGWRTIFIRR
jgi:uncharacterized Zn finger protein